MIRGMKVQPHTEQCRRRMEKLLADDARVKNARTRMKEKSREIAQEEVSGEVSEEMRVKRRKLKEVEDEAMKEEDPVKLNDIFEKYRELYQEHREIDPGEAADKKGGISRRTKLRRCGRTS